MLRRHIALVLGCCVAACSAGDPCFTQDDCRIGSYCERTGANGFDEGTCSMDCVSAADCPVTDPILDVGVCDNTGRCKVTPRPPRLRLLEPEHDTLLDEGTREVRLLGEVESAAPEVRVEIEPDPTRGCASGDEQTFSLRNETPGKVVKMSFASRAMPLDPGITRLQIRAFVGGVKDALDYDLEIPCPGCADVAVTVPKAGLTLDELELPRLEGTVSPPSVREMTWRVRSESGDVLDGSAPVQGGRFAVLRLPLFAGRNRVQAVVTGVGSGLAETRCSTLIAAGSGRERGLRVLLNWDGPTSDLDIHLVGPGGRFGDLLSDLSARGGRTLFGGDVLDDFDGLGPERVSATMVGDGVYGVVVEPVFDAADPGANALLRILWNGRLLVPGPIGPTFLSTFEGKMWVAGVVRVSGGVADWQPIDELVPSSMPPTRPPADWPSFY